MLARTAFAALVLAWFAGGLSAAEPDYSERPKRLVLLKSDGLPPDMLAAMTFPDRQDLWDRLPYGEEYKKAVDVYRKQTGKQILLPNVRKYFFEDGVWASNVYSETMTLSAVAWSVIETGQHSVVKGHGTFSRDTAYLRSHLDGFRDTLDALKYRGGKTSALWSLDQVGVSLMLDAYDLERTWSSPHIYRRIGNRDLLLEMGKRWLDNYKDGIGNIVRSHLSRQVTGIDYIEFAQELASFMTARNILERDLAGAERFDFLSPLFTLMDHQQHIDPHPRNMIHWLVKADLLVGEIFEAIEKSDRRDDTVVALVSDHGSEIQPGKVAFSFPITKVFRTPLFGGHTVKTLLVESAWNAISTPIPGIDFPRTYESDYSPYGDKSGSPGGQDGYVTCFIDSFGNARSTVNIRNDDLNRLHLILMRLKEQPDPERFQRLRALFETTLAETRRWLEPDLALYEDYHLGSLDLVRGLAAKADDYSKDSSWRLDEEAKRDAPQIAALKRLLAIRFERGSKGLYFDDVFSGDFKIEDYIPKGYFGPANSVRQLSRYTVGLDAELNWVAQTVDPQGNPVAMDYFEILDDYQAPNAPVNGARNPYDFISTRAETPKIRAALLEKGLVAADDGLLNVIWVKSTADGNPRKGGEALIVQTDDNRIKYLPISDFRQAEDGAYSFQLSVGPDPLALIGGAGFEPVDSAVSPLEWARSFHDRQDWLVATHKTEYSTAVTILLDIHNDPVDEFIDSPEFRKYLVQFSSEEMKQRYLRGLKRKYANQQPDFIVWAEELWNYNSKARTSGGSHAGLRPMVTRTTMLVWGGDNTRVARGRVVDEVGTTLDVAPTLFRAVDMLDSDNNVIRQPLSIPERPLHRLPGRVLDIWRSGPAVRANPAEEDRAAGEN